MIKEIEPNKLSRHLYRIGPYIYFFKAENEIKNNHIVTCMNIQSVNYPKLYIFQILWEKQIIFNSLIQNSKKNSVFLYFRGKKIKELYEPILADIQVLFMQAMEFYKQRLETFIKNQGSHIKVYPDKINCLEFKSKTRKEKEKIFGIVRRQKDYAKELRKTFAFNDNFKAMCVNSNLLYKTHKIKQYAENIIKPINKIHSTKMEPVSQTFQDNIHINNLSFQVLKTNINTTTNEKVLNTKNNILNSNFVENSSRWFTEVKMSMQLPNELLDNSQNDN